MSADLFVEEAELKEENKISLEKFNIIVSPEMLSQALNLVSRAVARHPVDPLLSCVLLESKKEQNKLSISATDKGIFLALDINAEVIEEGKVAIPAQKLQEIVSKLAKSDLRLEKKESDEVLKASCGRSNFEIRCYSPEGFPDERDLLNNINSDPEDSENKKNKINLSLSHIKQGCELVSFASEKREINNILNGVCIEVGERGLEIAATDGSRLAYYRVESCVSPVYKKSVVPFRVISELSRMLSDVKDESLECNSINSSISFETSSRFLSASLIDGSYPNYQQLIPTNYSEKTVLNRESFIKSLERVAVLANEKNRVIKLLFEEKGVLTISANTPEIGEAIDRLDLDEYEGNDFTIAFNVDYMLECLKNLSSPKIQIEMSESLKPLIVTPVSEKDKSSEDYKYLYILMPVQLRT